MQAAFAAGGLSRVKAFHRSPGSTACTNSLRHSCSKAPCAFNLPCTKASAKKPIRALAGWQPAKSRLASPTSGRNNTLSLLDTQQSTVKAANSVHKLLTALLFYAKHSGILCLFQAHWFVHRSLHKASLETWRVRCAFTCGEAGFSCKHLAIAGALLLLLTYRV